MKLADHQINYIRRLSVRSSKEIKQHLITKREQIIIRMVDENNSLYSLELSDSLNISIQNATTSLKSLYDKGWLVRKREVDPTGGNIYFYRLKL